MSAVLALFERRGRAVHAPVAWRMLNTIPERGLDGADLWIEGEAAIGFRRFTTLPEEVGECQPLVDRHGRCVVAGDLRLDNRTELIDRLHLAALPPPSDAALLLAAYERWGVRCVEHLLGDFAFVLWDAAERALFAARDPLGSRGLAYLVDADRCLVGSEIGSLLAHPTVVRRLNEHKVAAYLTGRWEDQEESFYSGLFYCPPAHCLLVTSESVRRWRYWELQPEPLPRHSPEEHAEHLRQLLTDAVRSRLRASGRAAVSLSGGLDSSAVAAAAAHLLAEEGRPPPLSVSYVFDELAVCDERRFIQPVVERCGLETVFVSGDGCWPLRRLPTWPVLCDFIFHDAFYRLPQSVMAAARERGCRLLLTGHFGDTLLARAAGGPPLARMWVRARRIRDALLRPGRAAALLLRSFPDLHPDFVARCGLLEDVGSAGPDLPQEVQRRRLLAASTPQGLFTMRRLYNAHGLEVEHPFFDRRLVEFAAALPPTQLTGREGPRRLLRLAAADRLPASVRRRRAKTDFYPLFARGLYDREADTVERLVRHSCIAETQIVRAEWLADWRRTASQPHQAYRLWLHLSLELWLRRYWFGDPSLPDFPPPGDWSNP